VEREKRRSVLDWGRDFGVDEERKERGLLGRAKRIGKGRGSGLLG
jgi:hypothetical protein